MAVFCLCAKLTKLTALCGLILNIDVTVIKHSDLTLSKKASVIPNM